MVTVVVTRLASNFKSLHSYRCDATDGALMNERQIQSVHSSLK